MPKIIHKRQDCIGCGACVLQSPNNWEMSENDGKANLKNSKQGKEFFIAEISLAEVEENMAAANACPVKIIVIKK